MKVPHDQKEAMEKFEKLVLELKQAWIGNDRVFKEQLDKVVELLQLGAYALPKLVLSSEVLEMHLLDVLKKELMNCLEDLRKGNQAIS